MSSCSYPHITNRQFEILKGVLMGDGYLDRNDGKPRLTLITTNLEFLNWLKQELDVLAGSLKVRNTENTGFEGGKTQFRLNTVRHPELRELNWYSTQKRYPDELELTPLLLKMWYVGDGGLHYYYKNDNSHRAELRISCLNEFDREDYLRELFSELPVNPWFSSPNIEFGVEDTTHLLNWMGRPPSGFKYKWINHDQEKYLKAKEEAYHYTELEDKSLDEKNAILQKVNQ